MFDAEGNDVLAIGNGYVTPNASTTFYVTAPATGSLYVGIGGYNNTDYDPATGNSGSTTSAYIGNYTLALQRLGSGETRLSGPAPRTRSSVGSSPTPRR